MSNVVNLNRFRKKKAKLEKEKQADTNRRLHGRTKAERALEAAQKERLEKVLRGAERINPTGATGEGPPCDEPT